MCEVLGPLWLQVMCSCTVVSMRWAGYKCTRVRLNAEIMDHRYYQFKSDYEEQITLIKVHFEGSLLDLVLFYVSILNLPGN